MDLKKQQQQQQPQQSGLPGMWTGQGDESYVKNSQWQASLNMHSFRALSDVLQKLDLPAAEEGPLVVADLGCSASPNTINMITKVVEVLRDQYISSGRALPEFQGCFSDLPANDFNTLFQLVTSEPRDFFVTGVPASSYGRLLPRASVRVFTSNHALHWTSQVPAAVLNLESPAYNGNRLWLEGGSFATLQAYKEQALADFRNFLIARAEELSPGGVLSCIFAGSNSSSDFSAESTLLRPLSDLDERDSTPKTVWRLLEHVLEQLVSEGIVAGDQRASMNLPYCFFTREVVLEVLADYNEVHVEKLETQSSRQNLLTESQRLEVQATPEVITRGFLAILGPFLKAHFREDQFCIFATRLRSLASNEGQKGNLDLNYIYHHMILLRK